MRLLSMALLLSCAAGWNYVEHHEMRTSADLSKMIQMENQNTMGFRGENSKNEHKAHWAMPLDATDGGRQHCMACCNDSFAEMSGGLKVRGLEACENGKGVLPQEGVRGSDVDGMAAEVRGFSVVTDRPSEDDVQPRVQVLLARENRDMVGATWIQLHGTVPDAWHAGHDGACDTQLVDYGWLCSMYGQCAELAFWNSSVMNSTDVGPLWMACAATLNVHFKFLDWLFITVDDYMLDYANITYAKMIAALVALMSGFMDKFVELMTVNHMWCCWTVSLVACLLASHLGLWRTRPTSRCEKRMERTRRFQMKLQLRAVLFASWTCSCRGMEQQQPGQPGEQAFLQRMAALAEAATSAATAAEHALSHMTQAGCGGSTSSFTGDATQSGLSMASRVLKNPDPFSGEDPYSFSSWKFGFCSWMSFGDNRFQKAFEEVEKLKPTEELKPYSPDERDLSTKLYAVLTSYLRGRCVGLVRSFSKTQDGFRLWRALLAEFEPPSRQRSLAVAQALASYPTFSSAKSALENVLMYESLVQTFEELSGQTYPEELKAATLIRCSCIEKPLNPVPETSAITNANGPVPMEVDRVYNDKGKGYKGKSKSKSKGKGWWSFGSYGLQGRGRGRGKGGRTNKGKGKGKQKGKFKSKSKDYGKKGGRKGKQLDPQQCRLCHEFGHWSRDCPNRMTNQVINNAGGVQPQQVPVQPQQQPVLGGVPQQRSATTSSYAPTSSTASTIRRIYGIPSSAMSSGSSVMMISNGPMLDDKKIVILDSGSDVSLLPLSCGGVPDGPVDDAKVQLRDCQGQELKVAGVKTASIVVEDEDGSHAELETQFVVSENVKSCILSLGQLYRAGWSVQQNADGPKLESPDRTLRVPVFFQRNSLAIRGEVCRVEASEDSSLEVSMVRAVVELEEKFRPEVLRNNVWETTSEGNPFMRSVGDCFIDPTLVWPATFRYRTTLIQKRSTSDEDHGWCVVEVSKRFLEMDEPFGRIPEVDSYAGGEPVTILTILSKTNQNLTDFGGLLDQGGQQLDVVYEPGTPLGSDGQGDGVQGEDVGGGIQPDAVQGRDIPQFQQLGPVLREERVADKVLIGEEEITASSSIDKLRRAARYLKVSSSGSKQKIFQRIREAHVTGLRMQALEAARQEYEAMDPKPRFTDAPKQPSAMERKLHEVTHLPFRAWCSFCVQAKSRGFYKHKSTGEEKANRTFPTVQVDFFTMTSGMAVLLMVDNWTKYVAVEPLRNKNAGVVGAIIARYLSGLSHFDMVEVAFDNEPVLSAGVKMAQTIRANQGLPLQPQPGRMYSKERTSLAERSIQTVRAQQKCLVAYLEFKIQAVIPESHPLRGWAMIHAAWLLNRFHITSSNGIAAFMAVRGRPYRGRVCAFGEEVYALDSLQQKYQCQWRKGSWLTKDEADHDVVAVGAREVIRSKAVRKIAEHWDGAFLLSLEVGPWDMKRGVQTTIQQAKPIEQPLPQLHASVHGVEPDVDERAVMQYAIDHPDEDLDAPGDVRSGGAEPPEGSQPPQEFHAVDAVPMMTDAEWNEMVENREKRDREQELRLPVSVRQRVAEAEPVKRSTEKASSGQPKFVKFDHTAVEGQKSKQPRTEMFSPTFAGDIAGSPGSSSGHVRMVVDELELYEEDEQPETVPLESWDWDVNDQLLDGDFSQHEVSAEDKRKRGFHNEEAGPPEVSAEELAFLDKQAMFTELERLRKLEVICDVQAGVDVAQALHLDTKLVRDWRFRQGVWTRRARMVAREFRGQSSSTEETFSPTTPLMMVKVLMVIALLRGLLLSALDVSDAFLQVLQREDVVVSVPNWVKVAAGNMSLAFWQLLKCLPGQRNAATRWNEHLTSLLAELNFVNMQGTLFRHREKEVYLSVHIDEQIDIGEDGVDIAPNTKYIPKLAELLEITDRRGKSVPHHNALVVFDAEIIPAEEYLDGNEAKVFRSALGICLYIAQERLDIQQTVRVLSSYMGRPTKTALCALRKLGSYLVQTQDMKMHYPRAELFSSTLTRWNGVEERRDGRPYELELYSDSDWASCKVTRRSTSSGLIFLNGCCIHSHSRAQASISLSSMEAEILAATSLLVEGIMAKQFLQFLLGDEGGLGNNQQVQMRLRLDSTSAQSFFNRLGAGRAKHLSTRLLWSQQAMRKKWFLVERVSTQENPADLNAKPLSRERREYLMKRIGLISETFEQGNFNDKGKVKQMVRAITAMLMTGHLQGCQATSMSSTLWLNPMTWTSTIWLTFSTLVLATLVIYLLDKNHRTRAELAHYKEVWKTLRETMNLRSNEDPFEHPLPDARREPFSGVWYQEDEGEEEEQNESDASEANNREVHEAVDREATPRPRQHFYSNGTHGASPDVRIGLSEDEAEAPEPLPEGAAGVSSIPSAEEGTAILLAALPEPSVGADGAEDDEEWEEESETRSQRYRRYCHSEMCEVSDPDEWADIHYGPRTSSQRSRSRSNETTPVSTSTPIPRSMPSILASQRDQRLAMERAEQAVALGEEYRESRGMQQSTSSSGSRPTRPLPSGDDENFYQDSLSVTQYYGVGLVPREVSAFDDYRTDLLMQGLGPKTVIVHNARELSNYVASCANPPVRYQAQRLLRHLFGLIAMLQSRDQARWISAAESVRDWLEADRDWTFFDEGSTVQGSIHGEEGEEEDRGEDDELVDPQDALSHAEPGDRGDEGSAGAGASAAAERVRDT
eukprot:s2901_g5.t1